MTPSSKKPLGTCGSNAATEKIATASGPRPQGRYTKITTPRKPQWKKTITTTTTSATTAPSKRRHPLVKPVGTSQAKLPSTTNAAVKTDNAGSSPRPKGTASGVGKSSRSERPPPR